MIVSFRFLCSLVLFVFNMLLSDCSKICINYVNRKAKRSTTWCFFSVY